jgi:hypothetical protein
LSIISRINWRHEVALFHFLLRGLDAARHHAAFDGLAFLHSQAGEHVLHPVAGENPHQIVFERQKEPAGAGIALTTATTAELQVDTTRLVPLGADDVQAAVLRHAPAFVNHPLLFADFRRQFIPN